MRHYSRAEWEQVFDSILGERLPGRLEQGVRAVSATQNYVLGAKREIGPRVYKYGLVGAGIGTLGLLYQSPVPAPLQIDLVPLAAYAIGTRVITLTLGNAAVLANEYAGGWLYVNQGTGIGDCLRIISHPAALALATCVFTCQDPTTITMVIANTQCSLVANPLSGIIVHPSPPTASLVGVPEVTIPIANFGWFQVRGPAAVLTDGVVYIHRAVRASTGVNGAVSHAIQEFVTNATGAIGAAAGPTQDSAGVATVILLPGGDAATYDLGHQQTIVGRVLRVGATTDMSLINLALE